MRVRAPACGYGRAAVYDSVGVPHQRLVATREPARRAAAGTCPLQLCWPRLSLHHGASCKAAAQRQVLARGYPGRCCSGLSHHPPSPSVVSWRHPHGLSKHQISPRTEQALHTSRPLHLYTSTMPQHLAALPPSVRARRADGAQGATRGATLRKRGKTAACQVACGGRTPHVAQGRGQCKAPAMQNVPVTVSTTLSAAGPRGLRGRAPPSAERHSSTRTRSACALCCSRSLAACLGGRRVARPAVCPAVCRAFGSLVGGTLTSRCAGYTRIHTGRRLSTHRDAFVLLCPHFTGRREWTKEPDGA